MARRHADPAVLPAKRSLDRLAESALSLGTASMRPSPPVSACRCLRSTSRWSPLTVVVTPDANWDMLPYLAVAEEGRFPDPAAVHVYVYDAVRAGVTEGEFAALTTTGVYRVRMAKNRGIPLYAADVSGEVPLRRGAVRSPPGHAAGGGGPRTLGCSRPCCSGHGRLPLAALGGSAGARTGGRAY